MSFHPEATVDRFSETPFAVQLRDGAFVIENESDLSIIENLVLNPAGTIFEGQQACLTALSDVLNRYQQAPNPPLLKTRQEVMLADSLAMEVFIGSKNYWFQRP